MKKYIYSVISFLLVIPVFAENDKPNTNPFKDAPWCHLPCDRIRIIVIGTLLGTIGLQILMLFIFRKTKKLKKKYIWIIYGVVTLASIAVVASILPQYLRDGFAIGRCFIGDPMGCK